ncbi:hypothetical protein VIBNISFn27_550065 [Vibrio nigripulchritudo SFn27]|uniref:Uncharacterized protein n=1 Tax=Vibrio nigripulchritudo TaxID=28173 RepID=U4K9V0_9VIBR|nr:hypothetical protein [Vibrio nigripulchritudo]CCN85492.1 hypothetical protein VIBNIBLFn1_940030 [Vibrio nigripulchritudo BLFn1]CCN89039.1 hypothetical protein VIBNISFn27_550065 [Vibrio nigripulchritudo SFn27]CCN95461.1 hypothetical protein VIBNIENn2_570030 [Vibrio nigripulchritudo ENn2]CCO43218.1 hypothetical protein VIBNISFn135_940031 [Vibrio nigripulchritudo SFn135]CCO54496.1 hypothetical protein VIBNIWn13_70064 [Vibrio nigripulchritudo Wn13]
METPIHSVSIDLNNLQQALSLRNEARKCVEEWTKVSGVAAEGSQAHQIALTQVTLWTRILNEARQSIKLLGGLDDGNRF